MLFQRILHSPVISIHALREEGDSFVRPLCRRARYFYPRPPRGGRPPVDDAGELQDDISIHALREEGDEVLDAIGERQDVFLSTPSARRATLVLLHVHANGENFYPRPPRGGRRDTASNRYSPSYFYPRPPRGGRRRSLDFFPDQLLISIHALREEGDSKNRDKISIFKQIIQHSARI